jgi:hypothetical protein
MKVKPKNNTGVKVLAVTAGVAALAAAGYFFFGPNGEKNIKKTKGWMIKMKGEIVEKIEKMKEVSEPTYHQAVDAVAKKYSAVKSIDSVAVEKMVKELKKHWKSISTHGKK